MSYPVQTQGTSKTILCLAEKTSIGLLIPSSQRVSIGLTVNSKTAKKFSVKIDKSWTASRKNS